MKKTKAELVGELRSLRHELSKCVPENGQWYLSTREYRTIIERAHDAFWLTNAEGEIVDANQAALRMLGYSREEFIGMHISMIDAAETPEETEAHIRHIIKAGSDIFESRHRRKDGSILDVEVAASFQPEDGGGGKFFAFVRDISKRKGTEARLLKRTHDFGERVKELNCLYTVSRLISRPDASLEEVAQGTADIIPPSWQYPEITTARVTMEGRAYTAPGFREGGWSQTADIVVQGETLGRIDVYYLEEREEAHEGPFLREERELINGIADMLGAALRNRISAKRLRESEERSRSIIESSPIGITVYDPSGQCVSANESIGRIIGATREQVLGQNFHRIESWKGSGLYEKSLQAIGDGQPKSHAAIITTTFGKRVYLDCYLVSFSGGGLLFMAHDITSRMTAEERFRTVVNLSSDAFMSADLEGRVADVNEAACRMLGYSRDELTGMHISEIDVIESPDTVRERIAQIQRKGSMTFESRQRRKDGSIVDVEVTAGMLPANGGESVSFGFVRDITERKRAETELRGSEEGLRLAQRIAHMGSWSWDLQGDRITWSDEIYRIFGLEKGVDISYNAFLGAVHPEDREVVETAVRDAFHGGGQYAIDHRIIKPDGTERIVHEQAEVAYDSTGKPVAMSGTVQDITERKSVEQELEKYRERLEELVAERTMALMELEERFGRAVSGAPIIFFTLDKAGIITISEGRGLEGLGLRPGELVGKSAYEVYREFPEIIEHVERSLRGEEHRSRVNINGLWLETLLSPLRNANGQVTGVVGVSNDITARKKAEEKSEEYLAELNRRNEELSSALKRAKAADRLKDEFMANISHELRTPMSGVIGITELLMETELTEDQREQLRLISSSADALLTIINDLLDFSKIEAGKLLLHEEHFSLREFFGDTINFFVVSAREKGVSLLFDVKVDAPDLLVGDNVRLRQVLVNLIGNAIKFTEDGSICVKVRPEGAQGARPVLKFSVVDTGIGISPEYREIIFDAFSQADGSATRKAGGTGLGLAISSRLVEMMGGRLGVESEPGVGSTFYFSIPLGLQPEPQDGAQTGVAAPGAGAPSRPRSILLAEDNMINQKLAVRILENAGHRVSVAGNGREALEILGKEAIDLVLMDIMMPVMDGMEATRAIRAREEGTERRTPIVAMTAHAMRGDREKFLDAGMDEYLSKPLKAKELIEVIDRFDR